MRFDVHYTDAMVERDLRDAQARLLEAGLLAGDAWRPTIVCDVSWLARETPEHRFVYLKDARLDSVVGVFSFQSSRPRRSSAAVEVPHAKLRRAYRGFGLASWVYGCALDSGVCLVSSARQSPVAGRLWQALTRRYAHGYVWVERRSMRYLGTELSEAQKAQLAVRMMLHGPRYPLEALFEAPRQGLRRQG